MAKTKDPLFLNKVRPNATGKRTLSEELGRLFFFYKKLDDEEKLRRIDEKISAKLFDDDNERRHQEIMEALGKVTKQKEAQEDEAEKDKRVAEQEKNKDKSILGKLFSPEVAAVTYGAGRRALQDLGVVEKDQPPPPPPEPLKFPEIPQPPQPPQTATPEPDNKLPTKPTAESVPTAAPETPKPTAEKIPSTGKKYGYLSEEQLSKIISEHEGDAEGVYGDYKNTPGKKGYNPNFPVGYKLNKYSDRPEDWSEKTLGKRKKLTDFTFSELRDYQKYRNSIKESTGAAGLAGFMPTTIFGQDWSGKSGLFASSGLSWNDKFSEENQKLLQGVLNRQSDAILKPGLAKLGINEITPGIKLAANYVGAAGVLAVMEEGAKDPTITVKDALLKRFPKQGDVTRGGTINTELATVLAKDFVRSKELFVLSKAKKLNMIEQTTATQLAQQKPDLNVSSIQNKDLKQTSAKTQQTILLNQTNNTILQPPDKKIVISPNERKLPALEMQQRG